MAQQEIEWLQHDKHALRQRLRGVPLAYCLGTQPFLNLHLVMKPGILIPRPETEHWVDCLVKEQRPKGLVLDIGTGSGCIALALAQSWPQAHIIGIDVDPEAIALARHNASIHKIHCEFRRMDVFGEEIEDLAAQAHLIVSNPPYIPLFQYCTLDSSVLLYEKRHALTPGDCDGLRFHQRLIDLTKMMHHHRYEYKLVMETNGPDQIAALALQENSAVWTDPFGIDRVVILKRP